MWCGRWRGPHRGSPSRPSPASRSCLTVETATARFVPPPHLRVGDNPDIVRPAVEVVDAVCDGGVVPWHGHPIAVHNQVV